MPTSRRLPNTTLALAVLVLLAEAPMHPYEMKIKMHERGHERAIPFKAPSIYDTVERLAKLGLIEPAETNREGRRPERTVYRLTAAGADELDIWLRHLLEKPSIEYRRFAAALMFLGALREKDAAISVLERRAAYMEAEIAAADAILANFPAGLPRLFMIEDEYAQAMRRAELNWLRHTVADLKSGALEWPQMLSELQRPMS